MSEQAAADLRHPLERKYDVTLRSLESQYGAAIRILHDTAATRRPVVIIYKSGVGYARIQFETWSFDPSEQQIQSAIERCFAAIALEESTKQSKKLQFDTETVDHLEDEQGRRADRICRLLTKREQQQPVDKEEIANLCSEAFKVAGLGLRAVVD